MSQRGVFRFEKVNGTNQKHNKYVVKLLSQLAKDDSLNDVLVNANFFATTQGQNQLMVYRREPYEIYLAFYNTVPVGVYVARYDKSNQTYTIGIAELTHLIVDPDYRRDASKVNLHVGDALVGHFLDEAKGKGYMDAQLLVENDNGPANGLYLKHGFKSKKLVQLRAKLK